MYYCAIPTERNVIRFSEYNVDGEIINFGSHNSYTQYYVNLLQVPHLYRADTAKKGIPGERWQQRLVGTAASRLP